MNTIPLDVRLLRRVFKLKDPQGLLYWRRRPSTHFHRAADRKTWNAKWAGKLCGTDKGNGYLVVRLNGRLLHVHRIAYVLRTGRDPLGMTIDHKNGRRADNEKRNVRSAYTHQNVANRTVLNRNNTSGARGVSPSKTKGRWLAEIKVRRKKIHLGTFKCKSLAIAARRAAELKHFKVFAPVDRRLAFC